MLAKEIVNSRRAKDRIHTSKAQLNSVGMQLQHQLGGILKFKVSSNNRFIIAQVKIAGTLKKSTEIMKLVNRLCRVPEMMKQMQDMQQEMMKAGIIEEMVSDTMDTVMDADDIEEEADEQVQKVLTELTAGLFGQVGAVGTEEPTDQQQSIEEPADADMEEMKARLNILKE